MAQLYLTRTEKTTENEGMIVSLRLTEHTYEKKESVPEYGLSDLLGVFGFDPMTVRSDNLSQSIAML